MTWSGRYISYLRPQSFDHATSFCNQQVHMDFKRQFLDLTVDKLLEQFVLNKYTGLEKPGEIIRLALIACCLVNAPLCQFDVIPFLINSKTFFSDWTNFLLLQMIFFFRMISFLTFQLTKHGFFFLFSWIFLLLWNRKFIFSVKSCQTINHTNLQRVE